MQDNVLYLRMSLSSKKLLYALSSLPLSFSCYTAVLEISMGVHVTSIESFHEWQKTECIPCIFRHVDVSSCSLNSR